MGLENNQENVSMLSQLLADDYMMATGRLFRLNNLADHENLVTSVVVSASLYNVSTMMASTIMSQFRPEMEIDDVVAVARRIRKELTRMVYDEFARWQNEGDSSIILYEPNNE